jgi:eukaryotic-like serine/threonine-protein kinase
VKKPTWLQSRSSRAAHEAPTAPGSEGAFPAVSNTRLKQATENTAAGRESIARSLKAVLAERGDQGEELPQQLTLESLLPEPTRSRHLEPLADRLEPEEPRGVYRVVRKLGVGGMATVYEAVKEGADGFRKRVALKRIHDHLAEDARIVELLADEARLASSINHPSVCQVLDFGVDSSGYFMALEYLDGFTLREVFEVLSQRPALAKEPRHQRVVSRIVAGLAEGLHAAHELTDEDGAPLDVVHRDVSPHNLFVLRSGSVKVTDFGVARAKNQLHHTATGMLKGKLAYSSPEQLHRAPVDRQTDVFALGVVLWELLTAQRLFDAGSESAIIARICREQAPDVRARQPGVVASLAAVARRALSLEPAKRFKTAREMASALERSLPVQGDSVPSTEVSDWLSALMGDAQELRRSAAYPLRASGSDDDEPDSDTATTLPVPKPAPTPPAVPRALATSPAAATSRARLLAAGVAVLASLGLAVVAGRAWRARPLAPPTTAPAVAAQRAPSSPERARPALPVVGEPAPVPPAASVAASPPKVAKVSPGKPPAPVAAEAVQLERSFGDVLVTAMGAPADVLVDGRNFGPAPQRVTLPPGVHTVALSIPGRGVSSATPVQVDAGRSSLITLTVPATRN